MIKVGLTGGIGSGKTTVSKMFAAIGVPTYIADEAGKRLMASSEAIKDQIIELLGAKAYKNNEPDRAYIASVVFKDKALLNQLNDIIHPAVATDFKNWLENQTSAYIIYEAAILFEHGGHKKFDYTILVTASYQIKLKRLLNRDSSSVEQIESRMRNQWDDENKRKLANFEIKNEDLAETRSQVEHLNDIILKSAKNS